MKMTKQTIVHLDDGDAIQIRGNGSSITVSLDEDRGPRLIIDTMSPIGTFLATLPNGDIEEPFLAVPNEGEKNIVFGNQHDILTIFLG